MIIFPIYTVISSHIEFQYQSLLVYGHIYFQRINFYGVSDSLFTSGIAKPKEVKREVARFSKGSIDDYQTMEFENGRLVIPPIPPSELPNCECIDIKYEVTVRTIILNTFMLGDLINECHLLF